MGGYHHHLVWLDTEQRDCCQVWLQVRLILFGQLGGKKRVPTEIVVFGQVDEHRHLGVGERRHDNAPAQPLQSVLRIRLRVEPVPDAVEVVDLWLAEARDLELSE